MVAADRSELDEFGQQGEQAACILRTISPLGARSGGDALILTLKRGRLKSGSSSILVAIPHLDGPVVTTSIDVLSIGRGGTAERDTFMCLLTRF